MKQSAVCTNVKMLAILKGRAFSMHHSYSNNNTWGTVQQLIKFIQDNTVRSQCFLV